MKTQTALVVAGCALLALAATGAHPAGAAEANPARDAILSALATEAKAADPAFAGFSAARGETLFTTKFASGKPETPSCSSCHSPDPTKAGQTRAGKEIEPMAVSVTPNRFTDPEKVAKWFGRNCGGVLDRPCTAVEKGDFLTFMISR